MEKFLPENILFRKDAHYNVSGLFYQDKYIEAFIKTLNDKFGLASPIASVHGAPPVLWNSGRIPISVKHETIKNALKLWEEMNIPTLLTFSNTTLTSENLSDKESNYLLDLIAERDNSGIILSSDILFDYIKSKYPKLKLVSSILKSTDHKGDRNKTYYENLAERFDYVVLSSDDSLNFPLLNELRNKDSFEILINEPCIYLCKVRRAHYLTMSLNHQNNLFDSEKAFKLVEEKCKHASFKQVSVHFDGHNPERLRSCSLIPSEMEYVYNLGYRKFKFQGRMDPPSHLLYDMTRYILEPTFAAPLVFKSLMHFFR